MEFKKIIINKGNMGKIANYIFEAQKRTTQRHISHESIARAGKHIEDKLNIPKVALEGTWARIDLYAQNFPNAYRGRPESTQFIVIFEGGEWRLAWVGRDKVRAFGHEYHVELSDTAKAAILHNASLLK